MANINEMRGEYHDICLARFTSQNLLLLIPSDRVVNISAEMEEEGQTAYRMTTRGITKHYMDSSIASQVDSTPSSMNLSHVSS